MRGERAFPAVAPLTCARVPRTWLPFLLYKGGMALDPSARLNNYLKHIIGRNCAEPEIIEILRLIRHVIEKDRSRSEYPHLSLYCDWVQHIEIARHPQGLAILERMNDIIVRHWSDTASLVEEVSHAFGLSQLRQEITLLFMSKEISTAIADSVSNCGHSSQ